jgi:hypothetical protein
MSTQGDRSTDHGRELARWAASGAMALTGRAAAAPLGPPAGLVPKLDAIAELIDVRSAAMGQRVRVDALALLSERAALAGLARQGTISCGGATRLMPAKDGWLAVSLARPDDVELVPAWLQMDDPIGDAWAVVTQTARESTVDDLVDRAVLVGLPVAGLPTTPGEAPCTPALLAPLPVRAIRLADRPGAPAPLAPLPVRAVEVAGRSAAPARALTDMVVVDLGALWAGPLCGSLLAAAGANVVKVESTHRPDGARHGPVAFFDLLNAGKRSLALDLRTSQGRQVLAELISRADVVVEGSRPRALEQFGIHAEEVLRQGRGPTVWASITGHGRFGPGRDRVAFGDDAAVAGGLVSWDGHGPCFCADAVADPTTGLVAAAAVLDALHAGGTWLLDVGMSGVAAHLAGPTLPSTPEVAAAAPRARRPNGAAPALGADNEAVLARSGAR